MQDRVFPIGIRLHTIVGTAAVQGRLSPRFLCGPDVTVGEEEKLGVKGENRNQTREPSVYGVKRQPTQLHQPVLFYSLHF